MDDPWRLTAREAKAALDRRQLRAIELVESCLAQIGAEDGGIKLSSRCAANARLRRPERAMRGAGLEKILGRSKGSPLRRRM